MLEKNSNDMKTVVQTFFIEETVSLIHDQDELTKWNDLVSFLELDGQRNLSKDDKSPIPFLWMNRPLVNVFETLCPREVSVFEYSKTPIPTEILEMIALSKREGYFDKITIRYDDQSKDPVCIGYKYASGDTDWSRNWNAEKYLLGKWSDVKCSIQELFERAKKRFIAEKKNEYSSLIKRTQRHLEDVEIECNERFGVNSSNIHLF